MTNMTAINELKTHLQAMLDSCEDKQSISNLAVLSSLVDKVESEHNQIQEEQKELLKDYKELVKHQSFAPNGKEDTPAASEPTEVSFDDFLKAKPNTNDNK